ncbi:MAG: V-type ATPase subunit [Chloroflexi bacterium]|nr:V-type ATPase subunit [Chloroflexota bacterium]
MCAQGASAYSLVQGTVRALRSSLLERDVWDALYRASDYSAVLDILARSAYGSYLAVECDEMTPRRAVYQLRWRLADMYAKLIRITPAPGQQLLLQLWRGYEVDNIKATLRGIETGANWAQVRHLLSPMKDFTTVDMEDLERMIHSETMVSAIQRLRGTPYYDTVSHALTRYEAEASLFPLEVALDLDYYRKLWESVEALGGDDHQHALRLVGSFVDANNLLWAIRYRVYHHLSEQEIINYTLPFGYRVKDADIRAIAGGAHIAPIIERIYPDLLGLDQLKGSPEPDLVALEAELGRHLARQCHLTFQGNPFHVGLVIAYLFLNELEIRSLTAVIEAKASQIPIGTAQPMIVTQ